MRSRRQTSLTVLISKDSGMGVDTRTMGVCSMQRHRAGVGLTGGSGLESVADGEMRFPASFGRAEYHRGRRCSTDGSGLPRACSCGCQKLLLRAQSRRVSSRWVEGSGCISTGVLVVSLGADSCDGSRGESWARSE